MKIYFDRVQSVFPTTIRPNDMISDQFAPVIRYQIEEPTNAFMGIRIGESDYLLWQSLLEAPEGIYPFEGQLSSEVAEQVAVQDCCCMEDRYPCAGEISLAVTPDVTMYEFLGEFAQTLPSETTRFNYKWLLGAMTDPMHGYVTDVWDASTKIVTGSIGFGTMAALVGVGAVVVGAIMLEKR